jgi:hypothetical protein
MGRFKLMRSSTWSIAHAHREALNIAFIALQQKSFSDASPSDVIASKYRPRVQVDLVTMDRTLRDKAFSDIDTIEVTGS